MEITTFIQWNCMLYFVYYGLNLAYDYHQIKREKKPETFHYVMDGLLEEAPVSIDESDYQSKVSPDHTGNTESLDQAEMPIEKDMIFKGPIEGQGILLDEFMANAKQYSSYTHH